MKLFIKNQAKKERFKHIHTNFYTDSLRIELHVICQGNPSLTCNISKDLHHPQDYNFKILKKNTKTFESNKNLN